MCIYYLRCVYRKNTGLRADHADGAGNAGRILHARALLEDLEGGSDEGKVLQPHRSPRLGGHVIFLSLFPRLLRSTQKHPATCARERSVLRRQARGGGVLAVFFTCLLSAREVATYIPRKPCTSSVFFIRLGASEGSVRSLMVDTGATADKHLNRCRPVALAGKPADVGGRGGCIGNISKCGMRAVVLI